MRNNFQSKSVPRGTRTLWRYLSALILLFSLGIGQMWGASPDYESYDWSSAEAMAAGIAGNTSVTISVVTSGSDGNVSGHHYKALNGPIDGSADGLGTYLSISSASQIDSVEIFFCPNGTSNTNLAWAGWGKNVTPSAEVGTNYGATTSVKSSKSWANATWQKIKVSDKSLYTLRISRQGKKLTNGGTKIDNFGDGQTVNLLGIRVWLHKYTVTLNPNGGSYASTPEGWTPSAGKYTKAVLAGSLALPEPAYSGNTFAGWKNKDNGNVDSPVSIDKDTVLTAQWTPTGGTQSAITYNNTKGASNTNPVQYTEGIGVASFAALADVDGFHFTGWNPPSIAADASGDKTINATWVPTYNVSFDKGAGSGTAPAGFQKWATATFELPGQGSMVAPSGKVFDGWKANGTGDKLAANAEYTMTAADVNFVAQWKATPTVVYQWNTIGITRIAGTVTSSETVKIKNVKTAGLKCPNNGVASGVFTNYVCIKPSTGIFEEGDTVVVTHCYSKSSASATKLDIWGNENTTALQEYNVPNVYDGTTDAQTDKYVLTADYDSLILGRNGGSALWLPAIKVIRPAQKDVKSTVYDLTAVKINGTAISAADLATLKTDEAYLLDLATEYPVGPTVKFARKTTITYEDDSQKVKNDTITVSASEVESKWQAQATIGTITYTVKMAKVSAAKVYYYNGSSKLGEEVVAIDESPVNYATYQGKVNLATFVDWYNNADLAEEHKIANIAELVVTKDTTVYGNWNPEYATSINIEQWTLTNGAGKGNSQKDVQTGALVSLLGTNNFASNLAYENNNLELDSLDDAPGKTNRNYAFLGLKVKKSGRMLDFRLAAGKTVKIKFGEIKSTLPQVAIDGGSYANMSITDKVYTYTAAADAYISIKTADANAVVFKQIMIGDAPEFETVTLPAIVTLDADGGTYADASLKYTGTPLVIGDATPADADHLFDGWYDGETKIDASAYVPTANVTLVAKYVVKPSPFSLTGLTYTVGAGEPQNVGYVEGTYTYTVELPYAGSYDAITVAATLKEAGSSIVDDATKVLTVTSLPGAATFTVSDGAEGTQLYTINFKKGAKDGVEIIGVGTTGGTNKTVSGLYKGDATVNLDSDKKIGSGKYIYVTLASGYTFEETDVLVVDVEKKSDLDGGTKALEITTGVGNIDGEVWKSIALEDYTTGENTIPLTGIAEEQTSIGLKRSTNQNAWINGLKVYRPMMPELTAISFNGVAATKGTGNAFSVTLPEAGTNLASLTIVPTIIRNAAHATTPQAVVSNEGAWVEGANTYRVMDKDGDYTDYTITITLQGAAKTPVITADPATQAYCAGSEPTLTVAANEPSDGGTLHYAWFKEAGETDEAVGTDAASYTVEAAGTYYVIVTNHVDGKLDKSVTSDNAVVTLNVAAAITKQPTNKRDIALNSEVTLSVEATNATGYQWYICDDAEKHNASAISGAEAANYVFNCTANAYYYCVVGNACGADLESNVVSVKLEPEGCNLVGTPSGNAYTQAGEWSIYPVNSSGQHDPEGADFGTCKAFDEETDVNCVNTRRFAIKFEKDVESVTIYARGGTGRTFDKVSVADEMAKNAYTELTDITKQLITIDGAGKEYIATAEGVIPGGKYAWFDFSGSFSGVFKICYTTALAMPKLPTLVNQELCAGAAYEAFDATITNAAACEGTVSYKWFSTADTETPVATTAEFTPSTDGTYYVVVTHSAAGHMTRVAQSAELTVAHFAAPALVSYSENVFQHMGTAAELSVVATGSGLAYAWYTCDVDGGNAEVISGAEEATYAIASIAEGVQYYKVVISNTCDATTLSHIFKVEGWDQLEQVDVTETTTWDMTNVSASAINLANAPYSCQDTRLLLANIDGVNNTTFNAQALMFEGQHIGRTGADIKHLAGRYVQFNVTVPGAVFVTFESNGNNARTISINGKKCSRTTAGTDADDYITYALAVEPGSVEIVGYQGTSANQYVRISKIEFKAEDNHHRPVNPAYLGTLCWTNNAILGGATLYEFQGKNENNYLVFDEVPENRLEAGKPYIFMPENGITEIKVYNIDDAAALTQDQDPVNNMYGTITGKTLVPSVDDNMYYFSSNHIWAVKDFAVNISVPAYYCYVDYPAVLAGEPAAAPAPGRRRVTMGVNGKNTPTGIDAINTSEQPMKLIIDGQMFILRGQKMFDATGRLVK